MIAGLGGTVLVVALVLLSLAVWRRYCSEAYYYLEETHSQHGGGGGAAAGASAAATPDWDIRSAVPAHLYVQHVQRLLGSPTRSSSQLAKEFDELNLKSSEKQFPSTIAAQPVNIDKNRYNNVLPCKLQQHFTL